MRTRGRDREEKFFCFDERRAAWLCVQASHLSVGCKKVGVGRVSLEFELRFRRTEKAQLLSPRRLLPGGTLGGGEVALISPLHLCYQTHSGSNLDIWLSAGTQDWAEAGAEGHFWAEGAVTTW